MTEQTIQAENITYSYSDESNFPAVKDVSFSAKKGELIAFVGCNGSGKTTFARLFNGLLKLQQGKLNVAGLDLSDHKHLWELHKHCGMIFQNPENQFISPLIEEDTSFALENYDWPAEEIPYLVKNALEQIGLAGYEKKSTFMLSGGQKQKLAIAGILVINPQIIIFDESTSMLDPHGKKNVMDLILSLHRKRNKTLIIITHSMKEAAFADRIVVFKEGRIIADGKPRDIFQDNKIMNSAGLEPPLSVKFYLDLKKKGIVLKNCPLNEEELTEMLCTLM